MDEPTALAPLNEKRYNAARKHITAFHTCFGDGHLYLAYHAAFPMALTPDLLYRLRANFQLDNNKQPLKILWITIADLLLSNLCEEVEYELYEMKADVRTVLLQDLKNDPRFGLKRMKELAKFLLDYVEQQMSNEAPALVQVQRWMALPYLDPTRAARELTLALQEKLRQNNRGEVLRMASLVETFADPLKEVLPEYTPLVVYAQNAAQIIRGEAQSAAVQLQAVKVFGIDLSIPEKLRQKTKVESEQPQTVRKNFFISYHSADRIWAEWVAWQLEEVGYSVLLRLWDFQPSANFQEEMAKATQVAERIIVLFSQDYLNALSSMPTNWRVGFLQTPNQGLGLLLPIRVNDCDPHALLGPTTYLDLVGLDEPDVREQLLAFVRSGSAETVSVLRSPGEMQRSIAERPQFPGVAATKLTEDELEVLIASAPEDETLLMELRIQLGGMVRQGLITIWDDYKIPRDAEWAAEINKHLKTASIILLLVSPDFIASEKTYTIAEQAMEKARRGEASVIPILLRESDWEYTVFGKLEPLPSNRRPVASWSRRTTAFLNIIRGIRKIVMEVKADPALRSRNKEFDVFLCYNSEDKAAVKEVAIQLMAQGLVPWLDEWELRPGLPWLPMLEEQIENTKTAAVFVGEGGIGPWQQSELEAFLREFVEYGSPVIPVLLPDAPQKPQLPVFLRGRQWVDFRKKEPDPITQLIWGITGKEPEATDEGELVRNPVFSNGYAVLIGVGADLPITVKNTSALHDLLVNPYQAAYPRYQVQLLTETLATRESILDAFDRLIAQVNNNPDATVIIYFSGHAMHLRDVGKPEKYFLIPYGYDPNQLIETAISDTEFTIKITEIKARKLAVFLDCGLANGAASLKEPEERSIEISSVSSDLLMMTRTKGKGIVVASCQQNEMSHVGTQYSIFTECLIEALEGKAKTEARKDDFIYINDVVAYLLEQVPQRTSDRQHPVVNQISNLSDNFPLCYYAGGSKDIPGEAPLPLRGYAAKAELVDKLLACSCMSNRGTRDTVLSLLNEQFPGIANSISRHTNNKTDVMEIVSTCLKYPGSLQELVGIVTSFEGESALPAQDLRAFLLSNSF